MDNQKCSKCGAEGGCNCASGAGMCCGKGGMGRGCGCGCHKTIPALIVLFGLLFLLRAGGWASDSFVMWVWPILVILGGLKKMFKGCKCC